MFTGFPEETLRFFLDIRFHNQISYFEQRRQDFIRDVQTPFYDFINELPAHAAYRPQMEIRPYKCLARIRRDTRFTKDKSPYRDHLWLLFPSRGRTAGAITELLVRIGPGSSWLGNGLLGRKPSGHGSFSSGTGSAAGGISARTGRMRSFWTHPGIGRHRLKRLSLPADLPAALEPWYRARELFVVRENLQFQWIYSPQIVERVWKDYRALAPLYKLFRGMADEVSLENNDL